MDRPYNPEDLMHGIYGLSQVCLRQVRIPKRHQGFGAPLSAAAEVLVPDQVPVSPPVQPPAGAV